jgi:hypothetical protein
VLTNKTTRWWKNAISALAKNLISDKKYISVMVLQRKESDQLS